MDKVDETDSVYASNKINGSVDEIPEDIQDKEETHFKDVVNAFRFYRTDAMKRVLLAEEHFSKLPEYHKEILPGFKDKMNKIRTCILHNYEIIKLIIAETDDMFVNASHSQQQSRLVYPASEMDSDKVKTTLRQIVRDWANDGSSERECCYKPVVDEIINQFPMDWEQRKDITVLVPGAGLGRLAFEIARQGFSCQGNEFSLFMLFTSNFILNRCRTARPLTIYPWVHQYSNILSASSQTTAVTFPDIDPCQISDGVEFSMAAGDFLEVYTTPDAWDCVATVFFIDTAHNILEYLETIFKILKPGGIWINFGPLLYHFADLPNESSIELSYEELKDVIHKFKFRILKEKLNMPAAYTQNTESMLQYQYNCIFLVCQKPLSE